MSFTIRPLDAPLGAEVVGFDIARHATPEAKEPTIVFHMPRSGTNS